MRSKQESATVHPQIFHLNTNNELRKQPTAVFQIDTTDHKKSKQQANKPSNVESSAQGTTSRHESSSQLGSRRDNEKVQRIEEQVDRVFKIKKRVKASVKQRGQAAVMQDGVAGHSSKLA